MLLVGRTGAVVGSVLLNVAASVWLLRGPLRELPWGRRGLVVAGCLFVMLNRLP